MLVTSNAKCCRMQCIYTCCLCVCISFSSALHVILVKVVLYVLLGETRYIQKHSSEIVQFNTVRLAKMRTKPESQTIHIPFHYCSVHSILCGLQQHSFSSVKIHFTGAPATLQPTFACSGNLLATKRTPQSFFRKWA